MLEKMLDDGKAAPFHEPWAVEEGKESPWIKTKPVSITWLETV